MKEILKVSKNEHYITMSNYHLKDPRLSIQAKGLLTLLLSMPDDWEYSTDALKSMMREDEFAIQRIINELTAAGYFRTEVIRDLKGIPYRTEYFVFERSQTGKTA